MSWLNVTRELLASVMSHGGETPDLWLRYETLVRYTKARVFTFGAK